MHACSARCNETRAAVFENETLLRLCGGALCTEQPRLRMWLVHCHVVRTNAYENHITGCAALYLLYVRIAGGITSSSRNFSTKRLITRTGLLDTIAT